MVRRNLSIKMSSRVLSTRVSKILFVGATGFNFVSIYGFLLILGWFNGAGIIDDSDVLELALTITAMQVGQSVGTQAYLGGSSLPVIIYWVWSAFLVLLLFLWGGISVNFIAIVNASVSGFYVAQYACKYLDVTNKWKYQLVLAIRAGLFYAIVSTLIYLERYSFALGQVVLLFVSAWMVIPLSKLVESGFTKNAVSSVALGLLLSQIYRNDVNYVRAVYEGLSEFNGVSQALVFYSFAVAISGFFVTNFVYTRVNEINWAAWRFKKNVSIASMVIIVVTAIAGLCIPGKIYYVVVAFPAMFPALISSYLHSISLSWFVYVAGALGAALGYFSHSIGWVSRVEIAFSLYISFLVFMLVVAYLVMAGRR